MRIRRRSLHQASSDPDTTSASLSPSQTPRNAARNGGCLEGDEEERPHAADADLGGMKSGVARRLALPQQGNAAVDSGASVGAGQAGAAGGDVHVRCSGTVENGSHLSREQKHSVACTGVVVNGKPKPLAAAAAAAAKVEEHASNNGVSLPVVLPPPVAVKKDEGEGKLLSSGSVVGGGGTTNKKRRGGPAVLLEGSRCSRVNGRGWRCSQPTLVGYSLCEHHLGKGRSRSGSSNAGGAGGAPGQLGRTDHTAARDAEARYPAAT